MVWMDGKPSLWLRAILYSPPLFITIIHHQKPPTIRSRAKQQQDKQQQQQKLTAPQQAVAEQAQNHCFSFSSFLSPLPTCLPPSKESPKHCVPWGSLSKTCRGWVLTGCIESNFRRLTPPSLLTNSLVATRFGILFPTVKLKFCCNRLS